MPEEYNPCRDCNVLPIVRQLEGRNKICRCPECGRAAIARFWNEDNPINKLAECYALLEEFRASGIRRDLLEKINTLLARHQTIA